MTRLIDRMMHRYGSTFWEGQASGAAVLLQSYQNPNSEGILPEVASHATDAYSSNTIVFSAMNARIALFGEARFVLQSVSDKKNFTDQRLQLLQHPWPDATEGDLLSRMEQDAGWGGNAYIWAPPGENRLVRWRPDWVTIISEVVYLDDSHPEAGWYRRKVGFHFHPPREAQVQFGPPMTAPVEEVAHWAPMPDPQANFRGMSWLTPVMREVDADSGMTTYKQQYLHNAASPNLLIKYSQRLQPGTVDAIRERMSARYGGTVNAFKTLVLDQGADATVIGNSLAQMNFDSVQQAGADRILAAANVPGIIIGIESLKGAGRSYQEVIRRFADLWARPEWRSCCAALQKLVPDLPRGGIRLWYDTSDIAALQEGEQEKAQEALIRAQALLTMRNAGYTRDSAVKAVTANDVSQLVLDPDAAPPHQPPGAQQTQHLLPHGSGPGTPGLHPLPDGQTPRLPVGTVSPGDGGNNTRPASRPASVRRADGGKPGMISLDLTREDAQKLPPGATGHHITLAYLGPDVSHEAIDRARRTAQSVAASVHGPLRAVLHSVDEFPPGEDGVPVFANVDSPDVVALHNRLAHLESPESKSRIHGYRPHVTLRYHPEPGMPLPSIPAFPVEFRGLHVHHGDVAEDPEPVDEFYPFRSPEFGPAPQGRELNRTVQR